MIEKKTLFTRQKAVNTSSKLLHWMIHMIMGLAIIAALWQHGHPLLTIIMVVAVIPLGLFIYIPESVIDNFFRTLLQFIVITGALFWIVYRIICHVAPDKFLIEAFALIGLSLSFLPSPKNYGYQFLISIIMIIYGGVYPRVIYVYTLPLILICGLIAAYQTRTLALAADPEAGIPENVFRRNWLYILLHLTFIAAFGIYIYILFPDYFHSNMGMVVVSYPNENNSYLAPRFNRWIKTKYHKVTPVAEIEIKRWPPVNPTSVRKTGPVIRNAQGIDCWSISGGGAGPPGKELVFRVASPVKLYWLANLYDVYDGKKWHASEKMKRVKITYSTFRNKNRLKYVPQVFIIEKWLSPVLYAAYMPISYYLSSSYYNYVIKVKSNLIARKFRNIRKIYKKGKIQKKNIKSFSGFTFYHRMLNPGSHYPALPFSYEVSSVMVSPEPQKGKLSSLSLTLKTRKTPSLRELRKHLWFENLRPEHYLQLPKGKISERIKELAFSITKGISGDYNKALALRDYLRTHYKYEEFSQQSPPYKEPVDYFLFNLKKGHCEYFAAALTVLARLNRIPARIAIGFSPGDYNVLTGYFEVYEYHAHAWTQIFISDMGWLTFDATPPGHIHSRTIPLGLGRLNDPFGDEWRITPPELTNSTKNILARLTIKDNHRSILEKLPPEETDKITKIALSIPVTKEEFKESVKKIKEKIKSKEAGKKIGNIFCAMKKRIVFWFKNLLKKWKDLIDWLIGIPGLIILSSCLICISLWYGIRFIYKQIYTFIRLNTCKAQLKLAKKKAGENPIVSINICYKITREILDLAGFPRKNMELFDYGASLKRVNKNLCKHTLVVFFIYSKFVYSTLVPEKDDAEEIINRTENVFSFLSENFL